MFNKPCSQLDSPWNELTQNDSYLQTNSGLENSYHLKLLWKMAVFFSVQIIGLRNKIYA